MVVGVYGYGLLVGVLGSRGVWVWVASRGVW